jgi:phosphatidylserine/phosphatidylglycerophosphate/cardiolipin synthase-like enzyme
MDVLMLATGFSGALTLVYFVRVIYRRLVTPPSAQAHFSPHGDCTAVIVREIERSRHEVLVLAYSFTARPVAEALVAASRRGVAVEIILDKSNEHEEHTDLPFLLDQGLPPLIDDHHAIAHNKIMLVDRHTLVTGSFNFTNQAEHENAENLVILKGHHDLIDAYRSNFQAHKAHARAPERRKQPAAVHRAAA